jgi:2-polyprenyl-6-methoxyphenol hydroxylase-like FAD-dependent oxidoreductase
MSAHDTLPLLEKIFERQLDGHRLIGQCRNVADIASLNFRTVTNWCWHDGKVVLAGDAAHTTYFNIGWGIKLAIEDVIELYYQLLRATEKVAVLRTLRTRAGPKAKAIYSKHKSV